MSDNTFTYQMLSRLQMDCDYYLGYGGRNPKQLWARNEKKQIEEMKRLWSSLPKDGKPEWLTKENIKEYERLMCQPVSKEIRLNRFIDYVFNAYITNRSKGTRFGLATIDYLLSEEDLEFRKGKESNDIFTKMEQLYMGKINREEFYNHLDRYIVKE